MPCGCGGASNVYKPPAEAGASRGGTVAMPVTGPPKVWNGPSPKTPAK